MSELRVRDVDEEVVAMLKDRARQKGISLAAEVRDALKAEAMRPRLEMLERLDRLRERIRTECGVLPDSTPLIREERDRRG